MKPFNSILSSYGTSIFEEMNLLAREFDALNLGQGAPDSDGPEDVVSLAAKALIDNSNQYPPLMGLPSLRRAVAAHDRRFYGLDISQDQVLITAGAT
ncbi:MAG: aminotransferase, partial [Rhodospirillaceae bacterium]|nr:aminotransferase [Rhodospirillaceae bacterium]